MKMPSERVTFVVATNNRTVLEQNLLSSPCLQGPHGHEILIQENFSSATHAYNDAIRKATNDLLIFIHQDMYLPAAWLTQMREQLAYLDKADPNWGVVGVWGAKRDGAYCGHIYSTGLGVLGREFKQPAAVQTLDEVVLIFRKSAGLMFDHNLPHFHFYGTDVCLNSESQGRTNYVISAFCVHNTRQLLQLPKEFYECYDHVRRVWKECLPIQTTCIRVTRMKTEVYRRKLEDAWRPVLFGVRRPADRVTDPTQILRHVR